MLTKKRDIERRTIEFIKFIPQIIVFIILNYTFNAC